MAFRFIVWLSDSNYSKLYIEFVKTNYVINLPLWAFAIFTVLHIILLISVCVACALMLMNSLAGLLYNKEAQLSMTSRAKTRVKKSIPPDGHWDIVKSLRVAKKCASEIRWQLRQKFLHNKIAEKSHVMFFHNIGPILFLLMSRPMCRCAVNSCD